MDPTDPTWQHPSNIPSMDSGSSQEEPAGDASTGYVDFAETDPVVASRTREEPLSPRRMLWLFALPLGFTFFLTCLFFAMRGVMDLGGFVATGGPYEIAHEAPSYVWIFPVSIIACTAIIFASVGNLATGGKRMNASLVVWFFWPAIFLSLGWNFFEYGFFKTDGLAWGWIVCAVLFIAMGAAPLYFVLKAAKREEMKERIESYRGTFWPQLLGAAAGIPLGILFFSVIS